MKTPLDPRLDNRGPFRLRLLPTLLTAALVGTAASSAVEVTFQYYRFSPTKVRDGNNQMQMSEFEFFFRGAKVDQTALTVAGAVTGGVTHPPADVEGVSKLVDGNRSTKWFDNNKVPVTFNFGTPTKIDSYRFATANDALARTPVQWNLEGSNDGITYIVVDKRDTADNAAPTSYFTFRQLLTTTPPAGLPLFASYNTTASVVDNSVSGQDVYQAFPDIVKNSGPSTSLSWSISNSPTSVDLLPGFTGVGATGTQVLSPITPDGFTNYALTATTAAGTGALSQKVRAVPGGTTSTRYVRFTPTSLRGGYGANIVQMAEFEFFNGATKLVVSGVTNPGGNNNNNAAEAAASIIDGNFRTKWLNQNNGALIFDLGSTQTFDSYQMTTGNDASDRDPVRWVLESSPDGINWSLIDNVFDYTPPTIRRAKSGQIPVSGIPSVEWTGSSSADWDTTTTNFKPSGSATPTTYTDGNAVVFGESASSRTINLTAPLSPNSLSVVNTTTPYIISGSPVTGRGDMFKRGSGELQLDSANTLLGAIYVTGGKLSVNNLEALGNRDAYARLEVSAGAELHVMTDALSERRFRIGVGGGTVNVDDGVTFTKYGPVDFVGTMTKIGGGTLQFNGYTGGTSFATDDIVVNEGVLEFAGATGYFNSRPFGGTAYDNVKLTVNTGAIARFVIDSALGGDYVNRQTSFEQARIIGGTLEFGSGFNYIHNGLAPNGEGRIVLQGGVITGAGQIEPANESTLPTPEVTTTFTSLASPDSSIIGGGGALAVGPSISSLTFDVADGAADDDLVLNRTLNGSRPLFKKGAGNLVLTGTNAFNGVFTVSAGTLTLSNVSGNATGVSDPGAATPVVPAALTLAAGATLQGTGSSINDLTAAGTISPGDEITGLATLTLGKTTLTGTLKIAADATEFDKVVVNGALDITGATLQLSGNLTEASYVIVSNTGARTGTFATVTGLPSGYTVVYGANDITVQSGTVSGYDAWSVGLSDPSPNADIDKDGIVNLLEYVLHSSATVSSTADLPKFSRTAGGDFVFTFIQDATSTYLNPVVEYSTDLTAPSWTTFASPVVQTGVPAAGVNTVTATLPAALAGPGGKLFARLRVTQP